MPVAGILGGTHDRDRVLQVVETALAPYLGETLARASTKAQCESLKLQHGVLTKEELAALLDRLAKGMRVFVGRQTTDTLFEAIRSDIDLAVGRSR